ncbi:nitrous oxide reductase accessory protein [Roseobacter sp. SK209-2-6]|uniref:nitrous oxide reductase accessory protein NosL n=1 Tax=Roseobacter sp. SK209-2-6 TaxID=388739 RepID=UPI0000F3EBF8|nr:nitrous oxide reductase accessory protein NosL [Roseobacter sp. SK209-2-6]EBA16854.1 nitrous oxide reductase accessory protein [Roseobacter sp. SK209-2-6]
MRLSPLAPLLAAATLALTACQEEEAKAPPAPVELTQTALSYFCQMNIAEHGGPKGQIHLEGYPAPLFFAQVRDMVAYLKGPERDADITAVYVSDMGVAASWAEPGADNWINVSDAVFVIDSNVAGGMGAPELVPFATAEAAQAFVDRYGGYTGTLEEIPAEVALGPIDLDLKLETPS